MVSFVIDSSKDFFKGITQEQQEVFFAECTRYFADKYIEENSISAVAHVDETTSHMYLKLMSIWSSSCIVKTYLTGQSLRSCRRIFTKRLTRIGGV